MLLRPDALTRILEFKCAPLSQQAHAGTNNLAWVLTHWPASSLSMRTSTWLVETEIAFFVEEQHFIGTTAGDITAKVLGAFSGNFCTKS